MKPRPTSRVITVARLDDASIWDWDMMSMSSRYSIRRIPSLRRTDDIGLVTFVKTHGALLRPKGRTLNSHISLSQENLNRGRWVWAMGMVR